jgi:hypothetical protein
MGQPECPRYAVLKGRRIVEFFHLLRHGLANFAPAVAEWNAVEPGRTVQHLLTLSIKIINTLGPGDYSRRLHELTVGRKGHPLMDQGLITGRCGCAHGILLLEGSSIASLLF